LAQEKTTQGMNESPKTDPSNFYTVSVWERLHFKLVMREVLLLEEIIKLGLHCATQQSSDKIENPM